MPKTAHGKRKSHHRHDQHEPVVVLSQEVPDEVVRAFCQVLKQRGWGALVDTISALVLEGTPYNDEDATGEYARVDAWLRSWITTPSLPEDEEAEPGRTGTREG